MAGDGVNEQTALDDVPCGMVQTRMSAALSVGYFEPLGLCLSLSPSLFGGWHPVLLLPGGDCAAREYVECIYYSIAQKHLC